MNIFRYNIVVAAYPVFVYVVSCTGRQVDSCLLGIHYLYCCTVHLVDIYYTNAGYAATTILIQKVHILTRDFS